MTRDEYRSYLGLKTVAKESKRVVRLSEGSVGGKDWRQEGKVSPVKD